MKLRNYFRLLAEDQPYVSRWSWFWKPILEIASQIYLLGLVVHRTFYKWGILKVRSLSCPVISIGNITWGGTGKTPIVEYVSRFYLNRRKTPLILTRGYGADEHKQLAKQLPEAKFGVGPNRLKEGAKALKAYACDVAILDDGFQHWQMKRDLDIVSVNVLNPFGNGSLLPRGILREPLSSLKRASIIVLTDVNLTPRKELDELKAKIHILSPKAEFIEAYREPLYFYRPESRERIQVGRLHGQRVTAFSGIGTPRSFQMLLNQIGLRTVRNFEYGDHHHYSDDELKEIVRVKEASESQEIITTEKDFYRAEKSIQKIVKPLILKVRLRLTTGEYILHQYLSRFIESQYSAMGIPKPEISSEPPLVIPAQAGIQNDGSLPVRQAGPISAQQNGGSAALFGGKTFGDDKV